MRSIPSAKARQPDLSRKLSHAMPHLLSLTSFTCINFIQVRCGSTVSPFSVLSGIIVSHYWMYHSSFIRSPVEGHLHSYKSLKIMSKAICLYTSFCVMILFLFSWVTFWSGIARLLGKCVFNFVINCQAVLQSGCTVLYFHPG